MTTTRRDPVRDGVGVFMGTRDMSARMRELRLAGVLRGIHWAVYSVVVDQCTTWQQHEVSMSAAQVAEAVHGGPVRGRRHDEVLEALAELAAWGAIRWIPGRGARASELGLPIPDISLGYFTEMDVDNVAGDPPRGGGIGTEGGEGAPVTPPGEGASVTPPGEGAPLFIQVRETETKAMPPCAQADDELDPAERAVVLDFVASARRAIASGFVPPALRHLNRSQRHETG